MGKIFEKLNKSELLVTVMTPVAVWLASKLGLSDDAMITFILGVFGLAGSYVAGRSVVKAKEASLVGTIGKDLQAPVIRPDDV